MHWNKSLRVFAAVAGVATLVAALLVGFYAHAGIAAAAPASSTLTNPDWAPFNQAKWVNGAGNSGFGLVTTSAYLSDGSLTYGGIRLKDKYVPSDPTSITAIRFDFSANQTGNGGGSPRLVVQFSDGGNGQLRPLTWTANSWATVDGMTGANWDNSGGTCGYRYATTWSAIIGCHPGQTITAIYVVNDSGWLYPSTGEKVTLDNVTVNSITATGPGANN